MDARQCWAHHPDGHRCQKRATHRNDHSWSITWTDSESVGAPLIEIFANEPIPFTIASEPEPDISCVACKHRHRSGECRCGCKEFIG